MSSAIRKMLWGAFAALVTLIVIGLGLTLTILQMEIRHEQRLLQTSFPLVVAVQAMEDDTRMLVSSARGFLLTQQSQFLQQYDDAIRDFDKSSTLAFETADSGRDEQLLSAFRRHFSEIRALTDRQIALAREGRQANALEFMVETARLQRSSPDFAGLLVEDHRRRQARDLDAIMSIRQWLIVSLFVAGIAIALAAAFAVSRIEAALARSIAAQVKRTEAMIAGMADGVMLIDSDGRTVFINPAGEKLLGKSTTGVPIERHTQIYGFRSETGTQLDARELPAAQALGTGRTIEDVTMLIAREDHEIAISMNATPLREDGRTTGVVVTFRDVTERKRLEEEMQLQAERAQILADAGAFFASNIDPVWVNQAIVERIAEVLGDWSAVILKSVNGRDLHVASIYHRDLASLGLAWSYIYRQPLVVGEGIIGQVAATGYPSLTLNVATVNEGDDTGFRVGTSTHANPMKLASLLILPLRTRREILGALIIAANDPDRAMTDEKLPLAEVLAERAALAIDNARLYTEQVEARRKVEDLSRLKDEFLSIASHELRTPVTSIKGYTQLAKTLMRENDVATAEEYLAIALDQIDRMSRLILELLDVSRIETGRLEIRREPIQWAPFVREIVQRHHTAVSERRFHVDIPDVTKTIEGDRDRLEQVLGNLLENAVKYSPEGSDIFVRVDDRGDHYVTSVCDRGMGIPADELSQVFERFHRGRQVSSTNYGGLGLGLYITKQIVERHGGSIWVESKEGVGTTFFFSLPVFRADVQPDRQPQSPRQQGAETQPAIRA